MITEAEIDKLAFDVIARNQDNFKLDDDKDRLMYGLAFNDGVISMAIRLQTLLKSKEANNDSDNSAECTKVP
jgi:hypothetical protein